ncbi:hypothetical protein B5F87_17520 [Eubacterium sp. An3]|nr:hypothetical protein B5F87_17520 [Eubacterium sp. An3]
MSDKRDSLKETDKQGQARRSPPGNQAAGRGSSRRDTRAEMDHRSNPASAQKKEKDSFSPSIDTNPIDTNSRDEISPVRQDSLPTEQRSGRDIHRKSLVEQENERWMQEMRKPEGFHQDTAAIPRPDTEERTDPQRADRREEFSRKDSKSPEAARQEYAFSPEYTNTRSTSNENGIEQNTYGNFAKIGRSYRDAHRKSREEQENEDWLQKMREKPSAIGGSTRRGAEKEDRFDDIEELLSIQDDAVATDEQKAADIHRDGADHQAEFNEIFSENGQTEAFAQQMRSLTNGAEKIWKMQYRSLASTGRFVMSYVEQTDAGQGYRVLTDNVMPVATFLGRAGKKSLASFAAASLTQDKKFQDALKVLRSGYFKDVRFHLPPDNLWDLKDVKLFQKDIRQLLIKEGIGTFSVDGAFMSAQLFRAKLKGRFPDADLNALYTVAKKTANIQALRSHNNLHLYWVAKRLSHKYMRQDDTMNAMLLTGSIVFHSRRTLRNAFRVAALLFRATAFIAKEAALLAAKAATAAAKTRLANTLAEKNSIAKKAVKSVQRSEQALRQHLSKSAKRKAEKKAKKVRKKAARQAKRDAILDRILPTRILRRKLIKPAKSILTKGRFNPLGWIGKFLGKLAAVKAGILAFAGILLAAASIFAIFIVSITAILEMFNWGANDKETRDHCFEVIASSFQSQMSQMENYGIGQGYRNIIYTFNDRDDDPSNDHKTNEVYTEEEFDYTETTNSVEMLSMAQVYFDFDLENADRTELDNYLRGLYNGSHVITTKEVPSEETDENGNAKYTDLEVILTTYYFDELFDCAITSASYAGGESPIAGEAFDIPQDFKQSITYEGTMEWAKGVATSPSNPMKQVVDAWYENGQNVGTEQDGMLGTPCIIVGGQKRYLCAIVGHFGQIGDYVDAYLEDGTILPLILIDNKGCYDGGAYHNLNTNFMFNGFHYGHTVSPGNQSVCSVLEFMKSSTAPSGNPSSYCTRLAPVAGSDSSSIKVTKFVNGGSFLKNPSGPQYVNGDTVVIDTNNANAQMFLQKLGVISNTVKTNASNVERSSGCERTFRTFEKKLRNNEKAEINCIGPGKWALEEMGLLPEGCTFYGSSDGTFHMPSGQSRRKLLNKMALIERGGAVGMTLNQATKEGKLQPGDIINLSSSTYSHSVVYAGADSQGHPMVYDGGGESEKQGYGKVGCYIDYSNSYQNSKIRTILRWK